GRDDSFDPTSNRSAAVQLGPRRPLSFRKGGAPGIFQSHFSCSEKRYRPRFLARKPRRRKLMIRKLTISIALLAAVSFPLLAGEWHSGANNVCTDCHTMHFSMQHDWQGNTPVPTVPTNVTTAGMSGNWLGASGPNAFLLKAPANALCLTCHDGQTFAPD